MQEFQKRTVMSLMFLSIYYRIMNLDVIMKSVLIFKKLWQIWHLRLILSILIVSWVWAILFYIVLLVSQANTMALMFGEVVFFTVFLESLFLLGILRLNYMALEKDNGNH